MLERQQAFGADSQQRVTTSLVAAAPAALMCLLQMLCTGSAPTCMSGAATSTECLTSPGLMNCHSEGCCSVPVYLCHLLAAVARSCRGGRHASIVLGSHGGKEVRPMVTGVTATTALSNMSVCKLLNRWRHSDGLKGYELAESTGCCMLATIFPTTAVTELMHLCSTTCNR